MMDPSEIAAQNDAIRLAVIHRFFFGSREQAPEGWQIGVSGEINRWVGEKRHRLMERIKNIDTFDDPEHVSATFDFDARVTSFELCHDSKLLLISSE